MIRRLRPRLRKIFRWVSLCLTLIVAILASAVVASLTVDLGPAARQYAESAGSRYVERPIHIGRLSIRLLSGRFLVEDLTIDGVHRGDRPFFHARRLSLSLDWLTAVRRRPEFSIRAVEMTDWQMLVEKWDSGHNFPKFGRTNQPQGQRPFETTLRYLHAWRGQFTYEDHQAPWSIVCPNLDINIGNLPGYHGEAVFTGGTVSIQDFVPFAATMKAQFVIDGPVVRLSRIDLDTDGAKTVARGEVDLGHWPEQRFDFQSRVAFPRMRQIFFANQNWDLRGDGRFAGTFHLFKDGRDLAGTFTSDLLGWNGYNFPALYGALRWTPHTFDVWNAGSRFYGGGARFTYAIKPLGQHVRPTARFEASYTDADMAGVEEAQAWRGVRFGGSVSGHNVLEWPLGRFDLYHDEGTVTLAPPPDVQPMPPALGVGDADGAAAEWGPFAPAPLPAQVPAVADISYRFDGNGLEIEPSRFATERTHLAFQGTTAWGERSQFVFHVTSRDWQESDQLLGGIMADFGSTSDPVVTIGGRGQFDGVMTGPFRRARVEGTFRGEDVRAWDTRWGAATGRVVFENGYLTVGDGVIRRGDSEIRAEGVFSLGAPRDDGGEEINARFRVARRDLDSLRHAFRIDEYPVSGRLSGEFHLTGERARPIGFGTMTIDEAVAYAQPVEKATASLRFDGSGVRLDAVEIAERGGTITGAAFVGWDSTYSINFDGRGIPVERIALFSHPRAPVRGVAQFSATGSGTFDVPRNDFTFRIGDLVVAGEPVGQVTGELAYRGQELSGQIDVASPRLAITGTGRILLSPDAECDLAIRFHDSSLDQWVRLFVPRLSPFTELVAGGSVRVSGELANIDRLVVDATVDTVDLRLFDPAASVRTAPSVRLVNASPVRIVLDREEISVRELELVGDDTMLRVTGAIGVRKDQVALDVSGNADLGILQGFLRDVRGSGRTEVTASVRGSVRQPLFSGSVTITDGRIRHFSMPNAFDAINGTVVFDARGIRLDNVRATMGGGPVQFGGRIGLDGYLPSDLDVTLHGEDMALRLIQGLRSTLDADLSIGGTLQSPTVGGLVMVKSAVWTRRLDAPDTIFDFVRRSPGGAPAAPVESPAPGVPLRWNVRIVVPSTLRVDTNLLRMVANADLTLTGSYDRPVLSGHADIESGTVNFEGRRYRITRGALDFNNPARIEPFFDVEAQTDVRVPGPPVQTYRISIGFAGTTDRLQPTVSSDPPLATPDVLALLFSEVRRTQAPELRALQSPNQAQTDILTARATQALTAPISSEVGKVVEQAFGVDTFQLTPSFVDPFGQQTSRINPTARLTIGKRISDRVYLTFSRSLGTTLNDQIVLLEIEQSDRLSWVFSRNEDQQTYALEFRVRHVF